MYYFPNEKEFSKKFKECIFCFDTNVLLNLYRYTPESRDNLIEVLQVFKDRVWIAHQAGFEFQRRRTDVLLAQIGLTEKLEGILDNSIEELKKLRRSNLFTVNTLIDPIKSELETIKKKLHTKKEEKPNLMTGDPVFDAVTELFDGKVGAPYSEEKKNELYKQGKKRYEAKIPPGYMDRSNKENDTDQYGDLVLWQQLIDYANTEARPIILVTDDAKEDWWREVKGEKLGPRPELISEFISATGGSKWFYMYSTEQFLKYSKKYLDADVQPAVIKEAEGIEKQDVEQEKIRVTAIDFQDAQDNYAVAEAIAQARTLNSDSFREALARINASVEEVRRVWAQTGISSEDFRKFLAQQILPVEEFRRAWQTSLFSEDIRKACSYAATANASQKSKARMSSSIEQSAEVVEEEDTGSSFEK